MTHSVYINNHYEMTHDQGMHYRNQVKIVHTIQTNILLTPFWTQTGQDIFMIFPSNIE